MGRKGRPNDVEREGDKKKVLGLILEYKNGILHKDLIKERKNINIGKKAMLSALEGLEAEGKIFRRAKLTENGSAVLYMAKENPSTFSVPQQLYQPYISRQLYQYNILPFYQHDVSQQFYKHKEGSKQLYIIIPTSLNGINVSSLKLKIDHSRFFSK